MPSSGINRSSIPHQAEEMLRGMILDGALAPGDRLNEVALAESIGISRGPLREAIKALAGQGYLTMEVHRGAFVKTWEPQEIVDLYELRSALELYSVRLVVDRASDDALAAVATELSEEEARLRESADRPQSAAYISELDFHQKFVDLGGNRAIREQLADANHKLFLALRPTSHSVERRIHALESHREVLDRVRARDEDGAVGLMKEHLLDSMNNSLSVLGLSAGPKGATEGTSA